MTTASSSRDKAFRLVEFFNPRSGTISWRVTGHHQGRRFRENHASKLKAESRRMELELERLGAKTAENLRATWLSPEQLKAAESVFTRHPDVTGFLRAFAWWEGHGAAQEAAMAHAEGLTLDQAAERFQKWLAATPGLRELSKKNLFYRVRIFTSELGDVALAAAVCERARQRRTPAKPCVSRGAGGNDSFIRRRGD